MFFKGQKWIEVNICCVLIIVLVCFRTASSSTIRREFVERPCRHIPSVLFRTGVFVESAHSVQKRSNKQPLRIHVEFHPLIDELPVQYVNLVKNELLPTAVAFLSERLQARRPLTSPLLLYRDCNDQLTYTAPDERHQFCFNECHKATYCGSFKVPEAHLQACYACHDSTSTCEIDSPKTAGEGVPNADFILYVQVSDTDSCIGPKTTAHASYCQLEASLDRPIAGHINICPGALLTSEAQKSILLTTVKHEIIHALGFSSSLFAFYRDEKGDPLTARDANGQPPFNDEYRVHQWSDKVIRTVTRGDWKTRSGTIPHTVQMLVTPKVREEARRHFNCPSLEGIELENDGGLGTMFSHFEKRILENEAMTGSHTHDRQFSRLTLAVLEDTGWYTVNYDLAHSLSWGFHMGCDFVKKSCKSWMEVKQRRGKSLSPYCDIVQSNNFNFSCDSERTSVAMCNLQKHSEELPPEYQYFNSLPGVSSDNLAFYGGTSSLADYCPFNQQFTYKTEEGFSKTSTCYLSSNSIAVGNNVAAELYWQQSVCINHNEPWTQEQCLNYDRQVTWGAGCYQYFCSSQGLKIVIEGVNHMCTVEGEVIPVSVESSNYRHQGSIICPACSEFCDDCPVQTAATLITEDAGDDGECHRSPAFSVGICLEECDSCGRREICCSNGCGHTCRYRVKAYNTDIPCKATSHLAADVKLVFPVPVLVLIFFWR